MLVITQLPQQIIHRTMIQIRISETEMLHATATRMIFNHNRTVAIVKFQQQIFAAQQKAGITLTDTVKNQSVLALTIMDRVMAITCTIAVFVIAPIAFHTVIAFTAIQHIITEFCLQIIVAIFAIQTVIEVTANKMIITILAMYRTATP